MIRPARLARSGTRHPGRSLRRHSESLLQIPLVARALADPRMRPVARAVDAGWAYERFIKKVSPGFNPFAGQIIFASQSRFGHWRSRPQQSARSLNHEDRLLREVCFYVHDYLHNWTYGVIRVLRPQAELGFGRIFTRNFEDLTFLHLVTEAAATVGLDYWYLATIAVNDVCPIGSHFGQLTVTYREEHLAEYRRARPGLVVQAPEFFEELVSFYCTGEIHGFDARDLQRSPLLFTWLSHEVAYGVRQREYTRAWLAHLGAVALAERDLGRPVRCDKPWQRRLVRSVGEALWGLVKHGADFQIEVIDPRDAWTARGRPTIDPRFVNLGCLEPAELDQFVDASIALREIVMVQYLVRHDLARFDRDKDGVLRAVMKASDLRGLRGLLRDEPMLPRSSHEPHDILVLA